MISLAAWVSIGAPLVGAVITPFLARVDPRARNVWALLCSLIAAVATASLLPALFQPGQLPVEHTVPWLQHPIQIELGVLVDPISIVLANVVAVISFVIMVYCLGYMEGKPGQTRFWTWMNGFIGSMLLLVLSSNLLLLFVGWKLVGVCSYALIGFYYEDQRKYWIGGPLPTPFVKPSEASLKALVVTGLGDMLMLAGILLVYFYAGTLNFLELYSTAPNWLATMASSPGMVILVTLLLLAGPLGKSAQFPFHEWLPEAMAGPGPVSALIHAATMVKSGVYLVARLMPLFYYGYWVADISEAIWFFYLIAWIGAFTALLAATQGLVALELKKVLAYSTVSQIGYMLLGLGAAGLAPGLLLDGYTAGIFHLVSHALFKACLFLCAGTVIHAVHSFYMTDMGAIRKILPTTWSCTLIAALSLMGVPPFPGFWSKDAVLLVTFEASPLLFGLALITVAVTACYTVRFFGLVFHGEPSIHILDVARPGNRFKDGSSSMRLAAAVLAVTILVLGFGGPALERTLHHAFEVSMSDGAAGEILSGQLDAVPATKSLFSSRFVPLLSVLFIFAGAAPAYRLYITGKMSPRSLLDQIPIARKLHQFFWNRWAIDRFLNRVFVAGTLDLSRWVADTNEKRFDHLIHRRLPRLFTEQMQRFIDRLRADTEELFYNVSYILILFGMLLAYLFLGNVSN